jgi:hypothetical protein
MLPQSDSPVGFPVLPPASVITRFNYKKAEPKTILTWSNDPADYLAKLK